MKVALRFACSVLLLLLSSSTSTVEDGPVLPPRHLGCSIGEDQLTFDDGVCGWVNFIGPSKVVSCWWKLHPVRNEQRIPTSYYPTALLFLDETHWLVAGKRDDGATVIESWTVSPPVVRYDGSTGVAVELSDAVVCVDTLYDQTAEGRDMVASMCVKIGDPDRLLVQFWDSKRLYDLELSTGCITMVASPMGQDGVLHVPALDRSYGEFWGKQHVQFGNVYVMATPGTSTHPLVLEDLDRDGDIDAYVVADSSTWCASFGSSSDYVD